MGRECGRGRRGATGLLPCLTANPRSHRGRYGWVIPGIQPQTEPLAPRNRAYVQYAPIKWPGQGVRGDGDLRGGCSWVGEGKEVLQPSYLSGSVRAAPQPRGYQLTSAPAAGSKKDTAAELTAARQMRIDFGWTRARKGMWR